MPPAHAVIVLAQEESEALEQLDRITTGDWLAAAGIFVGGIVLARVIQALTARLVERGDSEGVAAQLVGRVVGYLFIVAGFVYALSVLDVRIGPLLGALGIGGLALAFAAQTILENVFSSVLLQTRRPFRRGDQIASGDIEGTVEDVNFRTVVLRTYDGQRVLVPCSQVLNNPIVNYTVRRQRRTTLTVGVSYGADLRDIQRRILAAVRSVDGVRTGPAAEAWVEEFAESSIDFAVRFWHEPDIATMWRVRSGVAIAIKEAFDEAGIEIPFPQRTLSFAAGADDSVDLRASVRDETTIDR